MDRDRYKGNSSRARCSVASDALPWPARNFACPSAVILHDGRVGIAQLLEHCDGLCRHGLDIIMASAWP